MKLGVDLLRTSLALRAISLRDFGPWGRENLQGLKGKRVLASALQIARPSFGLNKW